MNLCFWMMFLYFAPHIRNPNTKENMILQELLRLIRMAVKRKALDDKIKTLQRA